MQRSYGLTKNRGGAQEGVNAGVFARLAVNNALHRYKASWERFLRRELRRVNRGVAWALNRWVSRWCMVGWRVTRGLNWDVSRRVSRWVAMVVVVAWWVDRGMGWRVNW